MEKNKKGSNWIPFPTGYFMGMINKLVQNNSSMTKPITMENLLRAKDRYLKLASILN